VNSLIPLEFTYDIEGKPVYFTREYKINQNNAVLLNGVVKDTLKLWAEFEEAIRKRNQVILQDLRVEKEILAISK